MARVDGVAGAQQRNRSGVTTVRPSTEADFEDWFALFEEVASEGRWIGAESPLDREERRAVFVRTLENPNAASFVAEADQRIVGNLGVTMSGGIAEFGMMIRDGYRGQGIGSALLEACLDWARSAMAHKVALSVWPHNVAAIALYKKFGFEIEGRLVQHYRRRSGELWDALLMGLIL